MKLWSTLYFVIFLGHSHAYSYDRANGDQDWDGTVIPVHFGDDKGSQKSEVSTLVSKDNSPSSPSEDEQQTQSGFIILESPKADGAKGGLIFLDKELLKTKVDFPLADAPWWERWLVYFDEWLAEK